MGALLRTKNYSVTKASLTLDGLPRLFFVQMSFFRNDRQVQVALLHSPGLLAKYTDQMAK